MFINVFVVFQKQSKSKVTEKSFRRQHLDSGMWNGVAVDSHILILNFLCFKLTGASEAGFLSWKFGKFLIENIINNREIQNFEEKTEKELKETFSFTNTAV